MATEEISSSKTTHQVEVGPGDVTGLYHITVCNLPFNTTWQQLKDWTRRGCPIEYVVVFEASTSAWVRVKGKENFEKTWARLNGGIFRGRPLIAADWNKNNAIKIKDYTRTFPSEDTSPTQDSTTPMPQVAPQDHLGNSQSQSHSPAANCTSIPSPNYLMPVANTLAMPAPGTYEGAGFVTPYALRAVSSARPNIAVPYQHQNTPFAVPWPVMATPATYMGYYPSYSNVGVTSQYVATEHRKVYLSRIPTKASARDLGHWVICRSQPFASRILSMDVPLKAAETRLRGFAYITMPTSYEAQRVVELLNHRTFQCARLRARLTLEGISQNEAYAGNSSPKEEDAKSQRSNDTGPIVVGSSSNDYKQKKVEAH